MSLMDKFSLQGKNALIGFPENIYGIEIACGLCEAGANVWLAGDQDDKLAAVAAEMTKAGCTAAGCIHYTQNGTIEEATAFADAIRTQMKTLDIFVENGGNDTPSGWVHSLETINELFQKKQTGLILTVQQLGVVMSEQGFGSMLFISDIHALVGCDIHNYADANELWDEHFSLEYGYIKGSYVNYTKQVAGFLGKYNARCNCIAYGPLEGKSNKAFGDAIVRHSHIKRLASADDVKTMAVFLASDASSFVTGNTFAVDGGYTVK